MNSGSVSAAFWVSVFLHTIGSVDMPGKGERKMPAPRSYVAIITLFSILHLVADAGQERVASAAAWITVLISMIKGPFGDKFTNFINAVAPPSPGASPLPTTPPDLSGGTP